jgi:hypothetical protein
METLKNTSKVLTLFSPTASSSAMKAEKTEGTLITLNQQMKQMSKWSTPN